MKKLTILLVILAIFLLVACDPAPEQALPVSSGHAAAITEIVYRAAQIPASLTIDQVTTTIAAGGEHSVAVRSDGTVVGVGSNRFGQINVDGWHDIVEVAAGASHTVGLRSDGIVVATGSSRDGRRDVGSWNNIIAVAAGGSHTVGLRLDGSVVATGRDEYGQLNVEDWSDIVAVAAGCRHTVGLRSDGTVVTVGSGQHAQRSTSYWRDIVAVTADTFHTAGLRSDGTVVIASTIIWQRDVNDWSGIVAMASGQFHIAGLRSDGSVVVAGSNTFNRLNVDGWNDIVAIASCGGHIVGLRADGTVLAAGSDRSGRLGVDHWQDIKMPMQISEVIAYIQNLPQPPEADAIDRKPEVMELTVERNADALFTRINELRTEASQPLLVRDQGLDRIAQAYAAQIFFDSEARSGDFQSLPGGERVISLAPELGVAVTGFDYSVFLGFSIEAMEDTGEFISKAIEGEFTRVGVVWIGEHDNFSSMVIIVYDRTAVE